MTRSNIVAWILWIFILLLIAAFKFIYWWADTPPKRPANVPSSAVFFWGPPVGLPAPKRGDWITCWFDPKQNVDRCRIVRMNGSLQYEGVFIPYGGQAPIPENQLLIDSKMTNLAQERVSVNATRPDSDEPGWNIVPLIYLHNGEILVPEIGYEPARQRLNELQKAHSPYAPASKASTTPPGT
jgi:hypothetical protein